MRSLADAIASEINRWGFASVEEAVFGTKDPVAISRRVETFCRVHLDATVEGGLFYRGSAGCTFGVLLSNGERAVLKAYQSRWTLPSSTSFRQ